MVGLQNTAAIFEAAARSKGTDDEHDRSWLRWQQFLDSVELPDDPFLGSIPEEFRPAICVVFSQALKDGEFSRKGKTDLAADTVRKALDQVAKVFEAHERRCPFKRGAALDFEFDTLMIGHRANDPPVEQEVAVTPRFLRQACSRARIDKERHLGLLFVMAFFWAMRSCEHLMTTGPRLTTSACMKDIEFVNFRGGIINQRSEAIFSAAAVRTTFRE